MCTWMLGALYLLFLECPGPLISVCLYQSSTYLPTYPTYLPACLSLYASVCRLCMSFFLTSFRPFAWMSPSDCILSDPLSPFLPWPSTLSCVLYFSSHHLLANWTLLIFFIACLPHPHCSVEYSWWPEQRLAHGRQAVISFNIDSISLNHMLKKKISHVPGIHIKRWSQIVKTLPSLDIQWNFKWYNFKIWETIPLNIHNREWKIIKLFKYEIWVYLENITAKDSEINLHYQYHYLWCLGCGCQQSLNVSWALVTETLLSTWRYNWEVLFTLKRRQIFSNSLFRDDSQEIHLNCFLSYWWPIDGLFTLEISVNGTVHFHKQKFPF